MEESEGQKPEENVAEKKEISKPKENFIDKVRTNPWMLSTIVLGILTLVFLVTSSNSMTGNIISEKEVGQRVLDFANSQGANAELRNVNMEDQFYEVTLLINEKEVPLKVTKDGKNIAQLIPLTLITQSQNSQNPESQDVPKSDKPKVELFVMAYCPYGTQTEKGILPVVNLLKDKIDFELKFCDYAMHDKKELDEQLNQYCIQKEQNEKFLDYLKCFLKDGDRERCFTETGIDKNKLDLCVEKTDSEFRVTESYNDKSTWLNGRYPLFNIYKDLNDQYGIRGSPSLVINGQQISSSRSPNAYLSTICQAFNKIPKECNEKLSDKSFSPGFGYKEGQDTDAQC